MSATLRAIRPMLRVSSGARFFSGHSHGGVPCAGHDAPYHELNEGAKPLKAVLEGAPKAFVYFTASWCGPCRKIAPFFSDLAAEHGASVQFVKVDVDANQETAEAVRWRGSRRRARGAPRPPPPPPRPHRRALPPPPQNAGERVLHPHLCELCGRQAHGHVHRGQPRLADSRGEGAAIGAGGYIWYLVAR